VMRIKLSKLKEKKVTKPLKSPKLQESPTSTTDQKIENIYREEDEFDRLLDEHRKYAKNKTIPEMYKWIKAKDILPMDTNEYILTYEADFGVYDIIQSRIILQHLLWSRFKYKTEREYYWMRFENK